MRDLIWFYKTSSSYMNYENVNVFNKVIFWVRFPKAYFRFCKYQREYKNIVYEK